MKCDLARGALYKMITRNMMRFVHQIDAEVMGVKNKWSKGDPVNLSDLLKITPVANEILHLSNELNMSITDVIWIASQILDNSEELKDSSIFKLEDEDIIPLEDDWEDIDLESLEDDLEQAPYMISVKIQSGGRFPEVGFKAGINEKEDMNVFFDMIMEMMDRLDG